ncbi:unnamed protein product [Caretta caretta]
MRQQRKAAQDGGYPIEEKAFTLGNEDREAVFTGKLQYRQQCKYSQGSESHNSTTYLDIAAFIQSVIKCLKERGRREKTFKLRTATHKRKNDMDEDPVGEKKTVNIKSDKHASVLAD